MSQLIKIAKMAEGDEQDAIEALYWISSIDAPKRRVSLHAKVAKRKIFRRGTSFMIITCCLHGEGKE